MIPVDVINWTIPKNMVYGLIRVTTVTTWGRDYITFRKTRFKIIMAAADPANGYDSLSSKVMPGVPKFVGRIKLEVGFICRFYKKLSSRIRLESVS